MKNVSVLYDQTILFVEKNTYQGILSLGIRESLYSLQYRFLHLILPQASLLYWFLCQVHIQQSRYQLSNYPIYNESLKKNQNRIVFKIFLNKSFKWLFLVHNKMNCTWACIARAWALGLNEWRATIYCCIYFRTPCF